MRQVSGMRMAVSAYGRGGCDNLDSYQGRSGSGRPTFSPSPRPRIFSPEGFPMNPPIACPPRRSNPISGFPAPKPSFPVPEDGLGDSGGIGHSATALLGIAALVLVAILPFLVH